MKKLFFSLVCLLLSFIAQAQSSNSISQPFNFSRPGLTIDSIARYLQSTVTAADSGEGGRASVINDFIRTWDMRVTRNDSSGANMFEQYLHSSQQAALARGAIGCNTSAFSGKWSNIGPDEYETQYLGMLNDIWADAVDTNYLLAVGYGGVWKSTNGGQTWHVISDNTPVSKGIVSPKNVSVNPTNNQHFYVGSGTYNNQVTSPQGIPNNSGIIADVYGNGLLVTTDGGATWRQEILPINNPLTWIDYVRAARAFFSPDGQRVYGIHDNKLFCKSVNGSWVDITPTSALQSGYYFLEMKFVPTGVGQYDPNHFYMVVLGSKQLLECHYNPTNQTHTFNVVPLPTNINLANVGNFFIGVPNAQMIYTAFNDPSNVGSVGLYRYDVSQSIWTYASTLSCAVGTGSVHASTARPGTVYYTCTPNSTLSVAYVSTDFGQTFTAISQYTPGETHGDVRGMYIQKSDADPSGTNDRVYLATDGGIAMKPKGINPKIKGNLSCKNINGKGLACGRFTGVSSLEMNGALLAGQMDNNVWSYEFNKPNSWLRIDGADGGESIASRTEEVAYGGESNTGNLNRFQKITSSGSRVLNTKAATIGIDITEGHVPIIPLWADQYGGFYAGQKHLWRKIPGQNVIKQVSGTGIQPGFTQYDVRLPEYKDANGNLIAIRSISFSQYRDSLTGYVIHIDGRLYYRNDLTTPAPNAHQFNSRPTTGFPNDFKPTDIVCDPAKPERVWLSLGGEGDNAPHNRVMYSPDAADHWFDISKGLPSKLPVVNIEYQEGSPYVYAATDVGVYRLDMTTFSYNDLNDILSAYNSVEWKCFNQGAPGQHDYPMINTPAMNINYCSGTLNTATYGRGIWSTPLWEQFDVPPITQSNIITTNTTWNTTRYLTSGIRVKSGAILTLSSTAKIHLPKDGQIRVEPGAKLIVDGATLTNGCKDCMWGGIVAEGKAYLPQSPANQATVVVQNNALIEHARNAITTWGGNIATAGAILNLSNSTFRNNKRSIEFISYHNTLAGRRIGNLSRISRCTFETDDQYRGTGIGYFFSTFISLWDVEGVVISGNTFTNTNSTEANFGNGITSFNAAYQVSAACNSTSNAYPCTNITRNTFSGLRHGVFAEGDNLTDNTFTVDQAEFTACGVGVLARTNNHFTVSRSNFNIGNAPFSYIADCEKNIGIRAVADCNGFRVEENTFSGLPGASPVFPKNIGVSLEHTGADNKEIYKNYFKALDYGVMAIGVNGNYLPNYSGRGARLTCNTFDEDMEDLTVFPGAFVHPVQATPNGGPSGNVFVNGHGWVVNNNSGGAYPVGSPHYIGYYHNGSSTSIPQAINVNLIQVPGTAACTSRYEAVRNTETYKSAFEEAARAYDEAALALHQHIDGGDTKQLLSAIENTPGENDGSLVNMLFSLSPYVSQKALRHAGETQKLSGDYYRNILEANPDVLRYPGFMDFLENSLPSPFPPETITALYNAAQNTTERGREELRLNGFYNELHRSGDEWLAALKTDTLGFENDDIDTAYSRHPALFAQYALAGRYLIAHDSDQLRQQMHRIEADSTFTGVAKEEHELYYKLWDILKSTDLSRRFWGQMLDSATRTALESIAGEGEDYGVSQKAMALLRSVGGPSGLEEPAPPPPPCVPDVSHRSATSNARQTTNTPANGAQLPRMSALPDNTEKSYLRLSPNPAKDNVTVDYAGANGSLQLRVLTTDGKVLSSRPLSGPAGTMHLSVDALPSGIYLVEIRAANKIWKQARIQVLR